MALQEAVKPLAHAALGVLKSSRQRSRSRIASCASSGTHTGVNSPCWKSRARDSASRRSVLMRSPGRRGISEGATTVQGVPQGLELTVDAVAAGTGLVAKPQRGPTTGQFGRQLGHAAPVDGIVPYRSGPFGLHRPGRR